MLSSSTLWPITLQTITKYLELERVELISASSRISFVFTGVRVVARRLHHLLAQAMVCEEPVSEVQRTINKKISRSVNVPIVAEAVTTCTICAPVLFALEIKALRHGAQTNVAGRCRQSDAQ